MLLLVCPGESSDCRRNNQSSPVDIQQPACTQIVVIAQAMIVQNGQKHEARSEEKKFIQGCDGICVTRLAWLLLGIAVTLKLANIA